MMDFFQRYTGIFLSLSGVDWRCDIMQRSESAFEVEELDFASNALTIEWPLKSKEDVVCGSAATLTLVLPGDRTYAGLYTIVPGEIRLDVYKEECLYWSGCLDPEFYEEPYSDGDGYYVPLIFSDFGILSRRSYEMSGIKTVTELLAEAMSLSLINHTALDTSLVTADGAMDLGIRSDNWFDETGTPSSWMDVLTGVLQPLALRLVQRNGKIWLYDLNGLYTLGGTSVIGWRSEDQMMGTDKVANSVKITFSPYAAQEQTPALEYGGEVSEDDINLLSVGDHFSYHPDYEPVWDADNISFTIFVSTSGNLPYIHPHAAYYKIVPLLGGEESAGIMNWFYTGGHGSLESGRPRRIPVSSAPGVLLKSSRVYLPALGDDDISRQYIRIQLPYLLDPRYNPFEAVGEYNEESNYSVLKDGILAVVPFHARIYDDDGNVLMHYENVGPVPPRGAVASLAKTLGVWTAGDVPSSVEAVLQYYDPSDLKASGLLGWKTNRQYIGVAPSRMFPSFKKLEPGQYLPYPPSGGWLEIDILTDIFFSRWLIDWADSGASVKDKLRWALCQAPTIEVVSDGIRHSVLSSDDIEYSGVLHRSAIDEIAIDTVCGSSEKTLPTARGLYLVRTDNGWTPLSTITRAGRTDHPEQLLIGTMYSQYADRKTTLKGTCALVDGDLTTLEDDAMEGVRMIILSETQRISDEDSEILAAELRPDEYTSDQI